MKTIQSIDRTMCILDYVSQHNGQATLTEISRSLNLAITTIHGLLSTLEMWSMLTKDSAGRYSLGCKLFQLSLYCQTQQKLLFLLQPPMRRLAEELGESVHLGLAMGDSLVYADRAEPQIPFRQTATVGETVPYYDSAIGLIIKAANNAIIPEEYKKDCNDFAAVGYCLKYEDYMDAYCLAVPFLQPGLPCSAGFSVVLTRERYSPEYAAHIVSRIQSEFRKVAAS